jgi:hypothetical protein
MNPAPHRVSPLLVRGTPAGLTALIETSDGSPKLALQLTPKTGKGKALDGTVRTGPAIAGVRSLRLALPPTAPPGTYEGVLQLADREQPIVVEVEPLVRLRAVPSLLALHAPPGGRVDLDLAVQNEGNAPASIRKAHVVALFTSDAVARAIHHALEDRLPEGRRRVDHAFDALADEHGGQARLKVATGAGPLAPGEARRLSVELAVPKSLRAGTTYSGTWPLYNLNLSVSITTPAGASQEEEAP